MIFADVEDLEIRLKSDEDLTDKQCKKAKVLLRDASNYLETVLAKCYIRIDPKNEKQARDLKIVCCNMVERQIRKSRLVGVESSSVTAGDFTETIKPSNPDGDLYITKAERELLGISKGAKIGIACSEM